MRLPRRRRRAMTELAATATPVHASPLNRDPGVATRLHPEIPHARPEQPCAGCAHSVASEPYPGMPSGERPCGFCVRNPTLPLDGVADWFGDQGPTWYGGETPPFQTPMDCYIATDRLVQQRIFDELGRIERGKQVAPREHYDRHPLTGDPVEIWCCDGGAAPGGHAWTCWRWLGVSFG